MCAGRSRAATLIVLASLPRGVAVAAHKCNECVTHVKQGVLFCSFVSVTAFLARIMDSQAKTGLDSVFVTESPPSFDDQVSARTALADDAAADQVP